MGIATLSSRLNRRTRAPCIRRGDTAGEHDSQGQNEQGKDQLADGDTSVAHGEQFVIPDLNGALPERGKKILGMVQSCFSLLKPVDVLHPPVQRAFQPIETSHDPAVERFTFLIRLHGLPDQGRVALFGAPFFQAASECGYLT
jgi:hypothetical protein